jgi:hypothetical protein
MLKMLDPRHIEVNPEAPQATPGRAGHAAAAARHGCAAMQHERPHAGSLVSGVGCDLQQDADLQVHRDTVRLPDT